MHKIALALAAAALLPGAASLSHAQVQKMRPGLWEHSVTMKSQSGQMEAAMAQAQKSLADMPPAQRRQMEEMLAQQGVSLGAKATTVKVCVTPEQADLDRLPPAQDGCTHKLQRTSPNTLSTTFSCPAAQGRPGSSGSGTMTMSSPTAYTGRYKVETQTAGKPEQLDMEQTGRWLAADCGAIKPVR
ncbi:DUF3617 domain-containing protein [Acidovorax sp.]|uniref:DUF3617 domain-containing protein n=1 Tax=Acidovorax sp. TaxID=1872122 RepID=UPI0025C53794|nr:DUF3617 domain-containing protein [Acidovorax sp.]MDH4465568.1 DUF3617 domain-containing protein [Acidovorax sp.]